ncbi:MAG TPA: T9SS type A sorting domain-containing protein, partial [Candidatus Kapabacteria bacterium]|nr:T9SS type A sorting domain-containing protein [Candidatus Kapabacteria bacterium]
VNVTLAQSIPDSLIIRYAIVQDGCVDNQNGGTSNVTLNDVVRYITYTNSSSNNSFVVVSGGASAGQQKEMSWNVTLPGPNSFSASVKWDYTKIRLIAFLETTSGGDFKVVNADILRQDLDTLQPPPPTLAIVSSGLDSTVLTPGTIKQVFYDETNLSNGVNAYYSLDNGATWNLIGDSLPNQFNWTVPDSLTTQGKIKLVAVGYPNLISIDSGTFTIGLAPAVWFINPRPGEVLGADTMYTIIWTKYALDSVKLEYSLVNQSGGYSTWKVLGDNITDTFYHWMIPDTNSFAELQLIPDNNQAPAASDTITIEKFVNSVSGSSMASGLAITSIFPNPAASGEEMILRYTESLPKPVSVQVLDLLGRSIAESYHVDDQAIHLDTHSLAPGAYIVRVTDGANVVSKRMEITR